MRNIPIVVSRLLRPPFCLSREERAIATGPAAGQEIGSWSRSNSASLPKSPATVMAGEPDGRRCPERFAADSAFELRA